MEDMEVLDVTIDEEHPMEEVEIQEKGGNE
jgi:hypothetical protein